MRISNYFADRPKLTEEELDALSLIECELMQDFITRWRELTFGVHTSTPQQMDRMFLEIRELKNLIYAEGYSKLSAPMFKKELADILIVMFCVASSMDFDLMDEVKEKMRINLTREWEITGPGVGRHTKKSPYELEDTNDKS